MKSKVIHVSGINNNTQQKQLEEHLKLIDGVKKVSVNQTNETISINFETPASLNNLEKEVYDLGFAIL